MSHSCTVGSWEMIWKMESHLIILYTKLTGEDGHLFLSYQSMLFLVCFSGEKGNSSRKKRFLFPLSRCDHLTPALSTTKICKVQNKINKTVYLRAVSEQGVCFPPSQPNSPLGHFVSCFCLE